MDPFTRRIIYRPAVLAVVLVTLMLAGCYRQWVSVGYIPGDAEWRSEQRVAHSKLEGTELKLYVGASNASRSWDPTRHEFALSLRFYLKDTGLQFDPRQIRLVTTGPDKEVTPERIEMVASAAGWESAWQCGHGPRQWTFSRGQVYTNSAGKRIEEPGQMLSLSREACFEFYFPVPPPSPDTAFTLRLRGLTRNGQPVEIPEVHFKKGSFWVWDFLGR